MSTKQMRAKFLRVRRLAAKLAERCDFVATSRIEMAKASCGRNFAEVCVECRDMVERAQVITAFTYGVALEGLSSSSCTDEDIAVDGGLLVTINIGHHEKEAK